MDISDFAVQHSSVASYNCQAALESILLVASAAHRDVRDATCIAAVGTTRPI